MVCHTLERDRAKSREGNHDCKSEPHIADAINYESFLCSCRIGRLLIPESDEEIRSKAHSFPTHIEVKKLISQDQQEHRSEEEIEVGEESTAIMVVLHVGDGVHMNQRANTGNKEHKANRKLI